MTTEVRNTLGEAERAVAAEMMDWGEGPRQGSDTNLYAAAYNAGLSAALRVLRGLRARGEGENENGDDA